MKNEFVKEFRGIHIGDLIVPTVGPNEGKAFRVSTIEIGAGAFSGWFTVVDGAGVKLLYAGEEIRPLEGIKS